MSTHKHRRVLLAAIAVAAAAGAVWACGPDFPNQLLYDRAATLKSAPNNTFGFEGAQLVKPDNALKASEPAQYDGGEWKAKVAAAENAGLNAAQARQLAAVVGLDGDQVYLRLAGLPEAIRLYAAGAADFHGGAVCAVAPKPGDGDTSDAAGADNGASAPPPCMPNAAQLDLAAARFQAVLELPPAQRKSREVDAAYMLARIAQQRFMACPACQAGAGANDPQQAIAQQFVKLRERVLDGAPDPQGLAVASYGDQARLFLHVATGTGDEDGGRYCRWQDFITHADCPSQIAPADYRQAIVLYAQQAAHGSQGGLDSLRLLASDLLNHPELVRALIDDPLSQRLLIAYALADGSEDMDDDPDGSAKAHLQNLVDAMQQRGPAQVADADRLAALAYGAGRYTMAASLAQRSSSPLAWWIRAKLALRQGDTKAAAVAYAQAIKAFPQQDPSRPSLNPYNTHLLQGEYGVLALARGDYVEAMDRLYAVAMQVGGDGNDSNDAAATTAAYGYDVAYLAERVLTTDELKAFVDAHAPASTPPVAAAGGKDISQGTTLADTLRHLLARRLMRDGRYAEALAYFPRSGDTRFGPDDLGQLARDYAAALHQAKHAWTRIGRAEGWYRAAAIARVHGMELLGYEQRPDYQFTDGTFEGGAGLDPKQLQQAYVTDGERARYARSVAQPDLRFHYRYVAADEASHAVDLLPPRSQAFAAVLCKATGWMLQGPPDYNDNYDDPGLDGQPKPTGLPRREVRAATLYARYVRQGAHVAWAAHFGRQCPAPDFDEARVLQRRLWVAGARHWVRRARWYVAGLLLLLLAGFAGWLWRRRGSGAPPAQA